MKKTFQFFFGFYGFIALTLCLTTGCHVIFPERYSDEQLADMRKNLLNSIEMQEGMIRKELLTLTEKQREERLSLQRLRLEELELDAMKSEFQRHLNKAKELEEIDRQRLNDHFRYNEVILRRQVPVTALVKKTQPVNNGWTLVVDWNDPVRENCIISGGDFCFNPAYAGKNAFLVVLTPVIKDQPGGAAKKLLDDDSEEVNNADALTVNVNNFYTFNRNYRVPCAGYHRVQRKPEQPHGLYAISGSLRMNRFGFEYQQEVNFISAPLRYVNLVSRYSFNPMLAAFAGDYIALLVPADDAVAYQNPSTGDAGDTYYKCSNFADGDNLLKLQSFISNYCSIIEINAENRLGISGKRRAAYSMYGDYLMPK